MLPTVGNQPKKLRGIDMAIIPIKALSSAHQIEARKKNSGHGRSLAMGTLGNECFRALWLNFRWCSTENFTAKTLRIFDRGNLEEARIIKDLERIGCKVSREQEICLGFEGYAKGLIDGVVTGLPEGKQEHILEFKTHNDGNFKRLTELGVKQSHYTHYVQALLYMHYLGIHKALYIATNKNDESRYHERLRYNKRDADMVLERIRSVITCGNLPPIEPPFGAAFYKCNWCKHGEFCYGNSLPDVTCRSCVHCDLIGDGKWNCSKKEKDLTIEDQEKACKKYKRLY